MHERLKELLEQMYYLLRDNGFSIQSEAIIKLIYSLEVNDIKKFKKEFKSSMLWGGAGSIRDIDLMNKEIQTKLDNYIKELKIIGTKVSDK